MAPLRTILFDLDDTLLETSPVYFRVIDAFVARLVRELPGVSEDEVRALQDEIDVRAAHAVGFAKHRFPESFVETYRALARREDHEVLSAVEQELLALGYSVFERAPDMVSGARELLEKLRGRVELVLYTLGVPEVQRVKVEHHGLERLFDEVHIVPRKSVEQLRTVVNGRPPAEVLVIGDSLRGEIGPALALGCRAVWVRRRDGWSYHSAEVEGSYLTIDSLDELEALLEPMLAAA
jgi:putative hydrolase of the HAD superfamily